MISPTQKQLDIREISRDTCNNSYSLLP